MSHFRDEPDAPLFERAFFIQYILHMLLLTQRIMQCMLRRLRPDCHSRP